MTQSADYCLKLLREGDFDRYIAVLFAPHEKRAALAALYAFNLEIARVGDSVKEPLAGELRLRWWADAIEDANDEAMQNPVLQALYDAMERYNLPKTVLVRACEARIFDLYNDTFATCADLEGYCGETASAMIQLAVLILDGGAATNSSDASGHGGVAQALGGFLRLMPITCARKQLYIPLDILSAVGASREEIGGDNGNHQAEARVAAAMIALAREHYAAFKTAVATLPATLRPAFLPLAPLPAYLKASERAGVDIFRNVVTLSKLRRQWLITKVALSGHFSS